MNFFFHRVLLKTLQNQLDIALYVFFPHRKYFARAPMKLMNSSWYTAHTIWQTQFCPIATGSTFFNVLKIFDLAPILATEQTGHLYMYQSNSVHTNL